MAALLAFLSKVPLRLYEYAVLALVVIVFVLWWDHREIQKGRDEIEAKLAKAQQETQSKLDKAAEDQNAKIEAQFNAHAYTPIDYTLPVNCPGKVPDEVRDAVNAAHHH